MNPDITLPRPKFKRTYTALITQSGTDAPTATVLQNTLGANITWTRDDAGIYKGQLGGTELFPKQRTTLEIGKYFYNSSAIIKHYSDLSETNLLTILTAYMDEAGSPYIELQDSLLRLTIVNICIYE